MPNREMQKLGEERSAIRELFEYGNARKRELGEENVFDFSLGNPSAPAPDCVREEIGRLLREVPAAELHGYSSAAGLPAARRAVAEHLRTKYHAPASEELVYMTCGAAASLTVILSALCNAGDEVVLLSPFFPEYRVFVRAAGAEPVEVRTDKNFHPDLPALERAIGKRTRAVIVNSPNNPTGATYSESEMRAIGDLLRKKSEGREEPVYLISDEPYRELVYGGAYVSPLNAYEHTVVCYSWSKALSLAGERIGYIAVSPECRGAESVFAAVCGAGRSLGFVCAPVLFQRVVTACAGATADIGEYRENRALLYSALAGMGYECVLPEGAFYLFVKSPEPDAVKFCERAKKYELLLVPSDTFGVKGYVRISYCVSRAVIEHSLPAFEKLIREYRR